MNRAALTGQWTRTTWLAALLGVLAQSAVAGCGGSSAEIGASGAGTGRAGSTGEGTAGGTTGGTAGSGVVNSSGSLAGGTSGSVVSAGTGGAEPAGGSSATANGGGGAAGHAGNDASGGTSGGGGAGANAGGSSPGGGSGAAGDPGTLPSKIVAGYYPNWTSAPPRLRDVEPHYNLIYLFAAKPVGGAPGTTGAVTFDLPGDGSGAKTHFNEDIAYARATQKRKILLSVGGAGAGMSFPNRQKSQTFVDSIDALYTKLGGFDGMDWNTFEADQDPDTSEMIWISLVLKKHHPGFIISAPPAPWNARDKTFCAAMVKGGALDYAAPQYYDGPNLATQSYMTSSVAEWVKLLGASKVVVGFGIWNQPNYMNIADALSTWKAVSQANPSLRGAFDWQIFTDQDQGWPFAKQLGPLVAP